MSPQDPTSPKQPLDADEQALADRLARIGPYGEPSPALDSKIMAAAHAAVGRQAGDRRRHKGSEDRPSTDRSGARASTMRRGRRPRWPLGLGIAASVALAIGLAWQLRPLPDAAPAYRSEAESALASPASESAQAAMAAVTQDASAAAEKPVPMEPMPTNGNTVGADDSARMQRDMAPADTLTRQPQLKVLDAPPLPPAPPAPPAPMAASEITVQPAPVTPASEMAAMQATSAAQKIAAEQTRTTIARQAAATGTKTGQRERIDASGRAASPASQQPPAEPRAFSTPPQVEASADAVSAEPTPAELLPIEAVPPATVASPVVRDAWLARIRELASRDRLEEARASLHEFILRYPHYQLPPDLRALRDASLDDAHENNQGDRGPAGDGPAREDAAFERPARERPIAGGNAPGP